ncbi:hypothetical protein [Armatimonas sp.]|uniref:hypothetical protein n=1 Tax=Armatimonas sp. TaxID=1872638 RepID=UPI00286B95EB|nr:hypothetical protein [Armatimonas sp.]
MNRLLIALVAVSVAGAAFAQDKKPKPATPKAQTKCAVTDEDLGSMGKPIAIAYKGKNAKYKGKSVKVCCGGCVGKVDKAQDKYFAKVFGK